MQNRKNLLVLAVLVALIAAGVLALKPRSLFDSPVSALLEGRDGQLLGARIASDGQIKGLFTKAFDFCRAQTDEIRIDTHADNKTMQHVVAKHGFVRCGIIHLLNGDPRIAYHYSKEA